MRLAVAEEGNGGDRLDAERARERSGEVVHRRGGALGEERRHPGDELGAGEERGDGLVAGDGLEHRLGARRVPGERGGEGRAEEPPGAVGDRLEDAAAIEIAGEHDAELAEQIEPIGAGGLHRRVD